MSPLECRYMYHREGGGGIGSVKNTPAAWNLSLIINGIPVPHSHTLWNPRQRSGMTALVKRGKMAFRLFLHKVIRDRLRPKPWVAYSLSEEVITSIDDFN